MAVFDVLVNNDERKGDHGLTFHSEHNLRTVLWGWIEER